MIPPGALNLSFYVNVIMFKRQIHVGIERKFGQFHLQKPPIPTQV